MPIRSAAYRTIEASVGDVEELLRVRRARGDSFRQIARDLWRDHSIEISDVTLRQWAKRLGIATRLDGGGTKEP